jgi:two-component system sensor histidine kinase DctS
MYTNAFKLLLVEDNPADARLVEIALAEVNKKKFEIQHVDRLSQALGLVGNNAFDAVLLDLSLPDSHGLETVEQLKIADPKIPIIVLSGQLDEEIAIQAVKAGAQDYLVKGQENGYLITRAIRYAIERKQTEEALRKAHDELEQRVEQRTLELVEANERLRAEIAEHEQSEAARQKSEERFRMLIDTIPYGVQENDTSGIITFSNPSHQRSLGYAEDELRGKAIWEVLESEAEKPSLKEYLAYLVAEQPQPTPYITRNKTRDGQVIDVQVDWNYKRDEQGRVVGFVSVITDITEQKKIEEQERQHLLQLAHVSRLSTLGEMATEIAHEINQPLTVIASYGDTCLRMLSTDNWEQEDVLEALGQINHQAERAGEVIRQIRNFVRQNESHRSTVDINELVQEIVQLVEVEARWHDVDIQLQLSDIAASVLANRILIQQVLMNFVRNAIDAMSDGHNGLRQLTIQTIMKNGDVIEVAVHDTGPGLSPESADQVFNPFYTTKADGMGMGLPISNSIIKAHEGQIWVTTNNDGGSSFAFSLPTTVGN